MIYYVGSQFLTGLKMKYVYTFLAWASLRMYGEKARVETQMCV